MSGASHCFVNFELSFGGAAYEKAVHFDGCFAVGGGGFEFALLAFWHFVPDLRFLIEEPGCDFLVAAFGFSSIDDQAADVLDRVGCTFMRENRFW